MGVQKPHVRPWFELFAIGGSPLKLDTPVCTQMALLAMLSLTPEAHKKSLAKKKHESSTLGLYTLHEEGKIP